MKQKDYGTVGWSECKQFVMEIGVLRKWLFYFM